jgi:hypothetical protein
MSLESLNNKEPIKKGQFFRIYDLDNEYILLDKTKRGLVPKERVFDKNFDAYTDIGVIYDIDGKSHKVSICWYFPKDRFGLDDVLKRALSMEEYYKKLREETCPD